MTDTPTESNSASCGDRYALWVWSVPILLIAAITLTYILSPAFYLKYVLSAKERELQAVEIITFASAFLGGILLTWAAWKAWRQGAQSGKSGLKGRGGAFIVGIIALASIFFAGEEISWGQSYFGWKTPKAYKQVSVETNLHNTKINVNAMGSVFLVVMFFGLPIVWKTNWPVKPPADWRFAIAEGPVVFSMACAFAWKEVKYTYRWFNPDYEEAEFYLEFLDQFNEHKEMLVAVTLLMYGVYRLKAGRSIKSIEQS
ncbi:MAG: hypothetical protein O7G85_02490 [Planctomycetota bacterium]|nr:hypothetical protein [Planctomycetota bacterium]